MWNGKTYQVAFLGVRFSKTELKLKETNSHVYHSPPSPLIGGQYLLLK